MEYGRKYTTEEKFREIRIARGILQVDLAKTIGRCEHTVIRTEKGERKFTNKELEDGRKFLGVENFPLLEDELTRFRGQLYVFRERIKEEIFDTAHKMQSGLAVIDEFPFEPELILLYKTINARLLLKERNIDKAKEQLAYAEPFLAEVSNEVKYHYYYGMGSLNMYTKNHEDALRFYMLALNTESQKELSLFLNLAICYARFGMYFLAVASLERIYPSSEHYITSSLRIIIDTSLALNYTRLGHHKKALELYLDAQVRAEFLESKTRLRQILHNLGCLYYKMGKHEEAIKNLDKASLCYKEESDEYLENLYFRILCLVATSSSQCNSEIDHAIKLAKDNEHYLLLFGSLSHLVKPMEKKDAVYIEDEIIPYLSDRYYYFKVMIYYEILLKFYAKNKTKASSLKASMYNIQTKMMREDVDI